MVYSNALYFASHFDKLTDEILSTFDLKQKLKKDIFDIIKNKDKQDL